MFNRNTINTVKKHIKLALTGVKVSVKRCLPRQQLNPAKPIILFLGVDAGLRPHFMAHCILARTLRLLGHNAVILRCYKQFSRCTVIESVPENNRTQSNHATCIDCVNNSYNWATQYDIPCLDMQDNSVFNDFPSDEEIEKSGIHFSYQNIPFGKICLSDILRNYKISDPGKVENELFHILIQYIKDSLKFYLIIKNIKKRYSISKIVYFGDYSFLFGAIIQCMRDGTKFSTLHQPAIFFISRDKIIIENDIWGKEIKKLPDNFKKWQSAYLLPDEIDMIADDIIFKLENKEQKVYSPPKTQTADLHAKLNIPKDKKILIAYTSSSDEMDALLNSYQTLDIELVTKTQIFGSQIDWLKDLIDFVERKEAYYLIVRIHPREGGAKDGLPSDHFQKLKAEFSADYSRTKIIWPNDKISSYDLAELADLVLISWSNIGNDLLRLGVPVLPSFNIDWVYPNFQFSSKEQYFDMIEKMASEDISINHMRNAFHWFYLRVLGSALDLNDIVPDKQFLALPERFLNLPKESENIEKVLCNNESIVNLKLEERQNDLDSRHFSSEIEQLLTNIRRFIFFLLSGEKPSFDVKILSIAELGKNAHVSFESNEVFVTQNYPYVSYSLNGEEIVRKYSPMIARLAKLLS